MVTKWLVPKFLLPALCLKTRVELADIMQEDRHAQPSNSFARKIGFCRFFSTELKYRQFQETLEYGRYVHRMVSEVVRQAIRSVCLSPSR